jgi:hypothetical protein
MPAFGNGPESAATVSTASNGTLAAMRPSPKALVAAALSTLALSACSVTANKPAGRGQVSDPRTESGRLACLRAHHLPVSEIGATAIQVGPLPDGPTIRFASSPGAAEGDQIQGLAQGAEVIGSALLYPNQASDSELNVIEDCVARGVNG